MSAPTDESDVKSLWFKQIMADIDSKLADRGSALSRCPGDHKRQLVRLAPWTVFATGLGTGAALVAASAAFVKLLG